MKISLNKKEHGMFDGRRSRLKELLRKEDYDAVLIDSPWNLYYYTGFTGGEAMAVLFVDEAEGAVAGNLVQASDGNENHTVFRKENGFIITDSRYYEQVEQECPDLTLVQLESTTYVDAVSTLFEKYRSKESLRVVLEETMNLSRYLKLSDALGQDILSVDSKRINTCRMVKDDGELAFLRRAEEIGVEAFHHILTILKPGVSEAEISLELEFYMKKQGASKLSFDTIVASGANSSMPHAQVTERRICQGDFVTMDFGCVYKGYCSDMTRTVAVGTPSEEMKKVYQIVLDANLRAMEGIRAGVKCSDIDALARDYIKEQGYGEYFGHGLGHSVGLEIHEEPRFSPKCHEITQVNMAITNEPGIYLPGRFGVRIEDLVIVKEHGCEVLSAGAEKELIVL